MKNILLKSFILILFCLVVNACKDDDINTDKEQDEKEMVKLRTEIDQMSAQKACEDASDWKFIAIGEQGCGGPTGFIAYSKQIDVALFLSKVDAYNQKQKAYNVKWKIVSTCALLIAPKSVECVDNKPKFVY